MIEKALFRKTEKRLYNYFKKDKKINNLTYKIDLLINQCEDIDLKLKNNEFSIPAQSLSMQYGEKVQTSNDCTSYVERAAIRIAEDLLREKSRKKEEINKLEKEIRNIEAENIIIEKNLKDIKEEDLKFLKLKYKEELKDWQIAAKLCVSQSSITRNRQRLIESVSSWEKFLEYMH